MKNFRCICIATLLTCGTYSVSNLQAENSEFTENYDESVHSDTSTTHESESFNSYDPSDAINETNDVCPCTLEDIIDDTEDVTPEVSMLSEVITKEITREEAIVTQEEAILEDDFDSMVNELVQSGAVEDDISALETQPKWKLLIARIGSYALSLGITCKQLVMNMYSNMQNTITNYWPNKNNN